MENSMNNIGGSREKIILNRCQIRLFSSPLHFTLSLALLSHRRIVLLMCILIPDAAPFYSIVAERLSSKSVFVPCTLRAYELNEISRDSTSSASSHFFLRLQKFLRLLSLQVVEMLLSASLLVSLRFFFSLFC